MKRPTIADIAREAGVSKGAVSYALNDQPGVSADTRRRILEIADRVGFRASTAARALAGAPSRMVGLALPRPASTLGVEPFFLELISGLEQVLSTHSYALLLQMVPDDRPEAEAAIYRQWWQERRVDGVLLCDLRSDDPRVPMVAGLGVPAVVIGPPAAGGPLPGIWSDDAVSMTAAVAHLAGLGHRRIARVSGPAGLAHTAARDEAFRAAAEAHGARPTIVRGDYTGADGARLTRELAADNTAIVYDNDIMAVAGLAAAQEAGVDVPAQLSIVAWDDSPICPLVHPPLTALSRDIGAYGARAGRLLLDAIAGRPVESALEPAARLTVRASTAQASTARASTARASTTRPPG